MIIRALRSHPTFFFRTQAFFSHKPKPETKLSEKHDAIRTAANTLGAVQKKSLKIISENYNYGFEAEELENSNELVKRALKLENGTPAQILHWKIAHAIKKYQKHPLDTASAGVQFAVMTEKVIFMTTQLNENRRDRRLLRDLNLLIDKRRKIMHYLQRTDFPTFKWVASEYEVPDQIPPNAHYNTNFKGQINRVQWSKMKGTKGEPRRR